VSWVDRRFELTFDGSIVGNRRDADPITFAKFDNAGQPIFNGGYQKLNAAALYHVNNFVGLFARVENLLNQNYQEVLGFPAYRLNFTAGLRVRFGGGK
jgi:outer membrane cobalamin receptor